MTRIDARTRWFFSRAAISLVALLLLLSAIAAAEAQRRGGGFAGGRGFSAPRSGGFGGGFGGGRGGSFGSSRPRSSGGGGAVPVFIPVPGGYGYGRGGGGISGTGALILVGIVVLAAGVIATAAWYNSRFALVNVGLNLRNGERYSDELEHMVNTFDYSTPDGRAEAIRAIRNLVKTEDVYDGFVTIPKRLASYDAAGKAAEEIARSQMGYIGVDAETVNVATPEGAGVKLSGAEETADSEESSACVLSMLVSMRQRALKGIAKGREPQAIEALESLTFLSAYDLDAVYFFYAPQTSEPLDPHAANRIFLDLKATAAAA